jgi:hypothetical protein
VEVKGVWASQPEEAEAVVSQLEGKVEEAVVSRPQEVAVVVEVVEVEVVAAEV